MKPAGRGRTQCRPDPTTGKCGSRANCDQRATDHERRRQHERALPLRAVSIRTAARRHARWSDARAPLVPGRDDRQWPHEARLDQRRGHPSCPSSVSPPTVVQRRGPRNECDPQNGRRREAPWRKRREGRQKDRQGRHCCGARDDDRPAAGRRGGQGRERAEPDDQRGAVSPEDPAADGTVRHAARDPRADRFEDSRRTWVEGRARRHPAGTTGWRRRSSRRSRRSPRETARMSIGRELPARVGVAYRDTCASFCAHCIVPRTARDPAPASLSSFWSWRGVSSSFAARSSSSTSIRTSIPIRPCRA